MTERKWPDAIQALRDAFAGHERFRMDTDMASEESLHQSDILISDWSGAALEYAFGLERPVLFVDVPRKINNPDYTDVACQPLEVSIRSRIGDVIAPNDLEHLPDRIEKCCGHPQEFGSRIREVRAQTVFNVGRSGQVGAEHLQKIAEQTTASQKST